MRSLTFVALALSGLLTACSTPSEEEDAEDGNSAVTTPRDKDEGALTAKQNTRTTELQRALQNAKAEDFGSAIPANIMPSIDRLLSL